jgi:hypothetical protein
MATDIFTLVGRITLEGAKEVKRELTETEQAAKDLSKSTGTMGVGYDDVEQKGRGLLGLLQDHQYQLAAAGAAMTAVGAGALQIVEGNQALNTSLSLTGTTLGLSRNQMQDLTIATADAGFPLSEVAATFDVLTRAGIRDTEELKNSAKAFDSLADATGGQADKLADGLVPAFKALGLEVPKTADEMDSLTWLTKNTQVGLDDFGSAMNYVAAYGQALGLSLDDMVGVMAALEAKGITGSAATRLFRSAITESKDGTVSFNDALGLTDDEIDLYKGKLGDATGITETYADAAESTITMMDKLKEGFQEVSLKASGFLAGLEPLMTGITGVGSALVALPGIINAIKVAQIGWETIMKASVIGAIVAAIAVAVYLIIKHWDKIKPFFEKLWQAIQRIFEVVWNAIKTVFTSVFNAIKTVAETIWNGLKTFFTTIWNAIKTVVETVWNAIKTAVETYINAVRTVIETVWNAVKTIFDTVWNGIRTAFEAVWNAIKTVVTTYIANVRTVIETVWNAVKTVFETVWNGIKTTFETVWNAIKAVAETVIGAIQSVLEGAWNTIKTSITTAWNTIKNSFETVWNTIKGIFTGAWDTIRGAWDSAVSWFKDLPGKISSALSTIWEKITSPFSSAKETVMGWLGDIADWFSGFPGKIADWFSGLAEKFKAPFKSGINALIDAVNWLIRGLNKIHFTLPDWVPGLGGRGFGISISEINKLAQGGVILRPALLTDLATMRPSAIVGERGPETVIPGLPGAMGGYQTANIVIEMDGRVLARALGEPLVGTIRLKTGLRI